MIVSDFVSSSNGADGQEVFILNCKNYYISYVNTYLRVLVTCEENSDDTKDNRRVTIGASCSCLLAMADRPSSRLTSARTPASTNSQTLLKKLLDCVNANPTAYSITRVIVQINDVRRRLLYRAQANHCIRLSTTSLASLHYIYKKR